MDEDGEIRVTERHDDVDILTDAAEDVRLLLGGRFMIGRFKYWGVTFDCPVRGKLAVKMGDGETLFDIYDTKYRYYDPLWSEHMLERREFHNGAWHLSAEDARFEEIYHALFHKVRDVPDGDGGDAYSTLMMFMVRNGYAVRRPVDTTIRFNDYLLESPLIRRRLETRMGLTDLRQVEFAQSAGRGGAMYFTAKLGSEPAFVRVGRNTQLHESPSLEYFTMEKAWKADRLHITKPLGYCELSDLRFVVMEKLEGELLSKVLKDHDRMIKDGDHLAVELLLVLKALAAAGTVHRDVRPENLMVLPDGTVKIFDFQFAVFSRDYREFPSYLRHPGMLEVLGGDFARSDFTWDDAYSFVKILELFPRSPAVVDCLHEAESMIGRSVIRYPRRRLNKYKLQLILCGLVPVRSLRRKLKERLRGF